MKRIRPEDLDLSAGQAFGSGNHPTTALCIDMLHRRLKPGDRFLDAGAGTGILMIMASRLGASLVVGFDKFASVARIALANLTANGVERRRCIVFAADRLSVLPQACFDVAAVNILPGVILAMLDDLAAAVRPGGILLCSGMILGNTHLVETGIKKAGFEVVCKQDREMWVGIAARRLVRP